MNIICDLDGTIALDTGRQSHLHKQDCPKKSATYHTPHVEKCICQPADRDWKSYFEACDSDVPNHAVVAVLQAMQPNHEIYILSGRSMSVAKQSLDWMRRFEVPFNYLQLRSVESRTDDHILKREWAKDFGLTSENTLFVLEDRQRVVDMWRSNGFRCFQVADGSF